MANTFSETGTLKAQQNFHIYYEDTDLSGFVYHANYLKFFERAREHVIGIEFLRELFQNGLHFVVSKAKLDYKAPAQHGDIISVESTAAYSRSPAIVFQQTAFLASSPTKKQILVEAEISIVILNKQNRPVRMPDNVLSRFQQMQPNLPVSQDEEESPPW